MEPAEMESMNILLKGEISAVESYVKALENVKDSKVAEILQQARDSHIFRVEKLRDAILNSGGEPIQTSGMWGSFATLVTGAAAAIGDAAIVSALEEGEDVGSNEYEWKMMNVHGDNRTMLREELWPKQQATHKLISKLATEHKSKV